MKTVLILALLGLSLPAAAFDTQSLATRPVAHVEDGVCHIHGAIWHDYPVRNAYLNLVEVGGLGVYEARTDERGEYRVSMPVGRAVFKEAPHERSSSEATRALRNGPQVICRTATITVGQLQPVK